jgi:hypothetical protein
MTSPLGSFSFTVDAEVGPAQRKLQQFVQQAQQAGRAVEQAFGGRGEAILLKADGTPLIREARRAEEAIEKVGRAAKQVADRPVTMTVRANLNEAERSLDRLTASARALGQARFNLAVRADGSREAEQAIVRLQAALRAARAGETINVNVQAASVGQADAAVRRLTADINAAKAAGARVAVNVQTNAQQGGFLREVGRGFLQQATPGLATGAAAAAGVVAAQAVARLAQAMQEGIAAGIQYNASLETSSVQMRVFLGSAEASARAMQRFQRIAEETPFSLRQINEAAASFSQVSGGNIQRLERLVVLATQLAAVNPSEATGGGLGGATVALREALSGDFTSIVERFRVSRTEINRLRELGLTGEALAVALVKAAGGGKQLSDALANTFESRAAKAAEILERLAGVATRPIFAVLSAGLEGFAANVEKVIGPVERLVVALDRLQGGRGAAAATALVSPASFLAAAAVAAPPARPEPPISPVESARQARIGAAQQEADRAERALRQQEQVVKDIEKGLEQVAAAARLVTEEYEAQLRPLEAQQRALDAQIAANQAAGREIAARAQAAEGPVETRAQTAGTQVILDHERELLEIRHRRAEISEQIAEAEQAAANRAAEAQIRAAERGLQAARDRAQAERDARQEVLEGVREEIRARQEARQAALEGMRAYIQAIQEARREALDAIREEIAARQEARREAIDGLREQIDERRRAYDLERENRDEARQAQQEAFAEQERQAERAHTISQDRYRDQIDALRAQADAVEERIERESGAQRELAAFERAEAARRRAQSVASAERNVLQARTGRERADALQRLAEIRAEATADARREELQARIERQREEGDRRREAIQAKIAELERKARAEDRAYQRDRDARREAFEAQQRAQAAADRAEEKAERERRRAEDAQVRALEKADREATKREQAEIKALEKADREQTKAENAAIRAAEASARAEERADQARLREEERAAREADRAADRALREQERAVAAQRDELQARVAAQEEARDAARLVRLRESAELEQRILDNRQRALEAQDVAAAAQAEADRVRNEAEGRALADRKAALDDQHDAIVRNRDAALVGLDEEAAKLTIAKDRATELVAQMEAVVKATQEAVKQAQAFGQAFSAPVASDDLDAPSHHSVQQSRTSTLVDMGKSWGETIAKAIDGALRAQLDINGHLRLGQWFLEESGKAALAVAEGFSKTLTDDQTAEKVALEWGTRSRDAIVKGVWDAQSPSKVTIQLGKDVAEGFVQGLATNERAIVDALEAPWIEVDQRFWPEVERKWKTAGADHAKAYAEGFKGERVQDDIDRCIDDVLRKIRENDRLFKLAGGRAAGEFSEGWCDLLSLRDCFAREMEWMENNAQAYGTRVGARFSTGFGETATVGGSPAGGGATGGAIQEWHESWGGICRIWRRYTGGWAVYSRHAAHAGMQSGPPPGAPGTTLSGSPAGSQPQARAVGGPLWPNMDTVVGEDGPEIVRWRAGTPTVIPHALSMSTLGGGGLASIGGRGAVSVSVNQTIHASPGMDANALARVVTDQAVAAIIDVLDDAERRTPNPLSRILPGALR